MPGSFVLLICLLLLVFLIFLQENHVVITLPRAEENKDSDGIREKTKGCANPIDEEYCRRTSNLFLINRLKTNVPVRSSHDGVGNSADFFVSYLVHAEIKPGRNFQYDILERILMLFLTKCCCSAISFSFAILYSNSNQTWCIFLPCRSVQ